MNYVKNYLEDDSNQMCDLIDMKGGLCLQDVYNSLFNSGLECVNKAKKNRPDMEKVCLKSPLYTVGAILNFLKSGITLRG